MNKALFAPKALGFALVLGISVGFSPALLGFDNKVQLVSMIEACKEEVGNQKDKKMLDLFKQKVKSGRLVLADLMMLVVGVSQKTKDAVLKKARDTFPKIHPTNDVAAANQLSAEILRCVK